MLLGMSDTRSMNGRTVAPTLRFSLPDGAHEPGGLTGEREAHPAARRTDHVPVTTDAVRIRRVELQTARLQLATAKMRYERVRLEQLLEDGMQVPEASHD